MDVVGEPLDVWGDEEMAHVEEAADISGYMLPESALEGEEDGITKFAENYLVMLYFYTSLAGLKVSEKD